MRHYVIVLDFGYADDPNVRSTVHDLAEITMREYGSDANATVLAQTESYRRLKRIGFPEERLHIVSVSQSATDGTKGGGSYHVLRRASQMMATFESERLGEAVAWPFTGLEATVIAHRLHLPRVLQQGRLFGLLLTPPETELPMRLYPAAAQWWCRSNWAWQLREIVGYLPLKLAHQL